MIYGDSDLPWDGEDGVDVSHDEERAEDFSVTTNILYADVGEDSYVQRLIYIPS
jgi:hypothetical protein